jgi:hypothetical protein
MQRQCGKGVNDGDAVQDGHERHGTTAAGIELFDHLASTCFFFLPPW